MAEYEEQKAIFTWAERSVIEYPDLKLLNASLNGVRLHIGQAMKAKYGGMKKGYPDIFLPVARGGYSGLFIELKHGKNTLGPEQREWLIDLAEQGFYCAAVWGARKSIKLIEYYLNEKLVKELKDADR